MPHDRSRQQSRGAGDYPDGGYGWVCVACCFLINALTWGIVASYGVYLASYLSSDTFQGGTAIDYALVGGLNFACALAATPLVSLISRSMGVRPPMLIGALLLASGYIAASFATKIWHLQLSQGVMVGLGVGFLYLPGINILPQWFDKRRSLASATSSAGSGIGGLIFALATGVMIRQISVAWALRVTGIVAGCGNTLAALFVRDRDHIHKPEYALFDWRLLKQLDVWLLLGWEFIMLFGYITIQFSLSDYALSVGASGSQADTVTALMNTGTACGRPFIGFVSDRLGRLQVASGLTLLTGVLCLVLWIPAATVPGAMAFAFLAGGIYGVFWACIGPLSAEVVEMKKLPSMLSIAWLFAIPPSLLGEVVALEIRRNGSDRVYLYSQVFAAVTYLVATGLLVTLSVRKRSKRAPSPVANWQ